MIVVTGGRRSGKTSAVIRWLLEDPNRGVVVRDHRRRQHFEGMLRESAPHIDPAHFKRNILTTEDLYGLMFRGGGMHPRSPRGHLPFSELAFDDGEEVLEQLFGARVGFIAMTATWIPLGPSQPDRVQAEVVTGHQIDDRPFFDDAPGTIRQGPRVPSKRRRDDVAIHIEGRTPPDANRS